MHDHNFRQDINDLQQFGLVHQVDYIAASFVRKAEDIDTIRMVLGEEGAHIKVRDRRREATHQANRQQKIRRRQQMRETEMVSRAKGLCGGVKTY